MAKRAPEDFEVTCPCCQAKLKVDAELGVVISHEPPPKKPLIEDLQEAVKGLSKEAQRREALFQQAREAEKNKEKILQKKFEEGMKKAKEEPEKPPPRIFDLD